MSRLRRVILADSGHRSVGGDLLLNFPLFYGQNAERPRTVFVEELLWFGPHLWVWANALGSCAFSVVLLRRSGSCLMRLAAVHPFGSQSLHYRLMAMEPFACNFIDDTVVPAAPKIRPV